MIWLYRILFLPLIILASPYYLRRMLRRGGYRKGFSQRFGSVVPLRAKHPGKKRIWLHAVSVGELFAVMPIIKSLNEDERVEIYLSTTTSTGYKLANERLKDEVIGIGYFPLDWWGFSKRAWDRINPDFAILTEGERWPEHLHQAKRRGVPVLVLNARISDRSFSRMKKAGKWLFRFLNTGITKVLAGSEHDASRIRELGMSSAILETVGNIKLDLRIEEMEEQEKNMLQRELGLYREGGEFPPILLGSSTWPHEEASLLEAYRRLKAEGHDLRLLIVPRHAERRGELEKLMNESGLSWHLRSKGSAGREVEVCVADTTGELRRLTQLARIVFVGKSLPPNHEGQSPVEAAALGKAIVFGSKMTNFKVISRELAECGAAAVVEDGAALVSTLSALWPDETRCRKMSEQARAWHAKNQGATERSLKVIREIINN